MPQHVDRLKSRHTCRALVQASDLKQAIVRDDCAADAYAERISQVVGCRANNRLNSNSRIDLHVDIVCDDGRTFP
jgi:hypothetical protein